MASVGARSSKATDAIDANLIPVEAVTLALPMYTGSVACTFWMIRLVDVHEY
jgi:hypothetical protein